MFLPDDAHPNTVTLAPRTGTSDPSGHLPANAPCAKGLLQCLVSLAVEEAKERKKSGSDPSISLSRPRKGKALMPQRSCPAQSQATERTLWVLASRATHCVALGDMHVSSRSLQKAVEGSGSIAHCHVVASKGTSTDSTMASRSLEHAPSHFPLVLQGSLAVRSLFARNCSAAPIRGQNRGKKRAKNTGALI